VRVGDRRWDLALQNGIKIALPAEDMEEALRELMTMDREQSLLSRDIVAVDLRFKDRFILRMPAGSMDIRPGTSRET
jgi:cell division protein FtsQ